MTNYTPYSTQHLFLFLKRAELLLCLVREDFLENLKKDPKCRYEIEVIQEEVSLRSKLEGKGKRYFDSIVAERDRVMRYLQSLVARYLEYSSKEVFQEDIHFIFNMVDNMYLEYEKSGKLNF